MKPCLHFKSKITNDPLGVMTSWNHTTHFCHWHGVSCSKRHHQRVIAIDLNSLKLSGSMSPFIGNLTFLRDLQLQDNSFSNEIPLQIGHLRRLQKLRLTNNSFSGGIPMNLSSCYNLVDLHLVNNKLVGEIHPEFGSLMKLKYFSVRHNHFTGNIPSSFGNLSSLQILSLTDNYLHGSIPHPLGQLRNLTIFYLASNSLSGVIPGSILNLSTLTEFDGGDNKFHGTLPLNLGTMLPNLQFFSVAGNKFTGRFRISLSNITSLAVLQLAKNNFSGKVPSLEKLHRLYRLTLPINNFGSWGEEEQQSDLAFICTLTNATALQTLQLGGNNFGGILPECIGNLSTKLNWFSIENNFITGRIPDGIGRLTSLTTLSIFNNRFSGTIPPSIKRLHNLAFMSLSNNQLSGRIPSLKDLTQLIELNLAANNLQGSIPSSLGECQNLLMLSLSENNLSGPIPPEIFSLSSLSIELDLSKNRLTGSFPMEVQYLKNVGKLILSENMLSGEIPSSLGSCTSLEALLLQGNRFHGTIPLSLSSLRALQFVDLSRNNFSGKLPEFLADLKVISLNLSYNNFEGVLPTVGIFRNVTTISIIGNSKLCGGIPEFSLPKCSLQQHQRRKTLIISVTCVLVGVILLVALVLIHAWFKNKRKEAARPLDIEEASLLRVTYNDLLKATNGFSLANCIGKGSFGSVYKGVLAQTNIVVAVKVLNLSHKGAHKSFVAECQALRNIRHRNLVKLLTACLSNDNHGNDFKALLYEFMINGSLEDWLHTDPVRNGRSSRNLDLVQRLDIAIHVASALEYLHQHCEIPIVHCDLKPSNVLLDNDMVGHVGDFGLAKFLAEGATNESSSVGVRGTIGYAPLEYGLGSEVSVKGDVYSFGILLLEMFTGKRPTDDSFSESGLSLRNYVKSALPNQVAEIIDPILLVHQENMNIHQNRIRRSSKTEQVSDHFTSILEIGISCSVEIPKERLPIEEVVAQLSAIRDKLTTRDK